MKNLVLCAQAGATIIASINAFLANWNIASFFMLFAILFSLVYIIYVIDKKK